MPTTVLAQQHWNTFRLPLPATSPCGSKMVSRFRKPSDVKKVLAEFNEGKVEFLMERTASFPVT